MPRIRSFLCSSILFSLFFFTRPRIQAFSLTVKRQADLPALSISEIEAFRPFTFYAGTAYCTSEKVLAWTCGQNCESNPDFQPISAAGDGGDVQRWYVGIDPKLQTVILGHQGTNLSSIDAVLTDLDIRLDKLEPELFPGLDDDIKVHIGFAEAHAETAHDVRAAVKKALDQSGLSSVTLVGHSMGGALSLLDAVSLPLFFPNVSFRTIIYGTPRVGNKAFAEYVNDNVKLARINNRDDLIPIIPGRFLGFRHPHGELHIQDDLSWLACPGNDSTDKRCSTGDVVNIFDANLEHHSGPYDTVFIGC